MTYAIWAPVVAALGASFLTGLLVLLRDAWRDRRDGRATLKGQRRRAYEALLVWSGLILHTSGALHATMEHRSGLTEGLDVVFRLRKPADPMDVAEIMRRDTHPLYEAWSAAWACGTEEAIGAANDLVRSCGEVVKKGTVRGAAHVGLSRWLLGEKWTPEQLSEWGEAIARVATSREAMAQILRMEIGVGPARLFEGPVSEHDSPLA